MTLKEEAVSESPPDPGEW
ncbi:hypothetical protein HRG_013187 [Hirsutella rhossiliensis]